MECGEGAGEGSGKKNRSNVFGDGLQFPFPSSCRNIQGQDPPPTHLSFD